MKVIAFDVFGTVFDFSSVDREEIRDYVRHVKAGGEWKPLSLPESWEWLPAHPDAVEGIRLLREDHFVVTCSNGPLGLLAKMSRNAGIQWDAIVPLEISRTYKPDPAAYMTVCNVLDCKPTDVTMVTANKTFGDLEASAALGMNPVLIRGDSLIETIVDLADYMKRWGNE